MTKKVISIIAATAFALGALSAPTTAGNAYGRIIKAECGLSYGQLVSAARRSGHVTGRVGGAKRFVKNGLLQAHIDADPSVCPNSPNYEAPQGQG
jgi:hypothetical protein